MLQHKQLYILNSKALERKYSDRIGVTNRGRHHLVLLYKQVHDKGDIHTAESQTYIARARIIE